MIDAHGSKVPGLRLVGFECYPGSVGASWSVRGNSLGLSGGNLYGCGGGVTSEGQEAKLFSAASSYVAYGGYEPFRQFDSPNLAPCPLKLDSSYSDSSDRP